MQELPLNGLTCDVNGDLKLTHFSCVLHAAI
ncbi:hypothetical protein AFE_1744 [Acidithiobacillus ferrooxidans ATCC 23270]|uniref:Uncharacterized protein n=1 Tax=Acidithiobacillus ferrooxidans (strain ATCC 23270 / DSM 14882 / CIP 104768 / NCIMB 8455) TaxID=243159 RepID=B7JBK2_ACIF2|nr:hypothetical protein AFE_1744 [Acidithiobacillus ferrooxidans ATCC 23270]